MDINGLLNAFDTINVATTKRIGFNVGLNTSLRESSAGVLALQLAGTDVLTFNPTGIILNTGQNISLFPSQRLNLDATNNNFINSPTTTTIDIRTGNVVRATFGGSGNSFSGNSAFDTNVLFVDSVNNWVGLGTATPAYQIDIRGASDASQVHISRNSSDIGGYFTSVGDSGNFNISGGSSYNGTNFIAKWTNSTIVSLNPASNTVAFFINSGLTAGNTFTPTNVFQVSNLALTIPTTSTFFIGSSSIRETSTNVLSLQTGGTNRLMVDSTGVTVPGAPARLFIGTCALQEVATNALAFQFAGSTLVNMSSISAYALITDTSGNVFGAGQFRSDNSGSTVDITNSSNSATNGALTITRTGSGAGNFVSLDVFTFNPGAGLAIAIRLNSTLANANGRAFQVPTNNTDPTGGGGAAVGRIPIDVNGTLRYLAYY
ncbi:MAG TPA: hypothetical protein PLJ37_01185 [Chitinophagales bacterium]|nr:hypothetical protein [Chitinophagales bacterium]HMW93440.1 hypothetical protein [Chitinophagales bacterium]HMZ92937.1 hypothetical protein [Chitinophagales bacterium]HNG25999.1 hypothetical protein [Chitinophagales bacterium]